MRIFQPAILLALAFTACAPGTPPDTNTNTIASKLSANQKKAIGKKIWQNESGGTLNGLTAWNVGEEFPSLGIGHFIWYPSGFNGRFTESWPQFIAYATANGATIPEVAKKRHSPWTSREHFMREFNSAEMKSLRTWLASTIELQTDFITSRSLAALPKILNAAPASERAKIEANYHKVASTPQGVYALIDYVNFKGDGTSSTEKYKGYGWGLLQVLGGMNDKPSGSAAATEFAASAKRALNRRIENSPSERGEARWREGWNNRCDTYARPLE